MQRVMLALLLAFPGAGPGLGGGGSSLAAGQIPPPPTNGSARVVARSEIHRKIEPDRRPLPVVAPPDEALRIVYANIPISGPFDVYAVDIFIGQDRGDRVESMVTVFTGDGRYLASRVLEKEVESVTWRRPRTFMPFPVTASHIQVHVLSRVTGSSLIDVRQHPSYGKWRAVMDWNVTLVGKEP